MDPPPQLKIEAYGVRVGIRLVPPIEPDEVIERLPPGYRDVTCPTLDRCYEVRLAPNEEHELKYHVLADGVILAVRRLLGRALDELESDLELFIAAQTRERMFVHAGVVSWRGRAIVLPGRSLSGKTTLVIELLKAGADYYSDEFAVFDARGLIHPYPRRLAIRDNIGRQRAWAHDLGARTGLDPLRPALIAFSHYCAGTNTVVEPLSCGRAALALMANTVGARNHPSLVLSTLSTVAVAAPAVHIMRGEAAGVCLWLLDAVEYNRINHNSLSLFFPQFETETGGGSDS